jgi:hypothetical protein
MSDPLEDWAASQRRLARALGLSLDEWMQALDDAGARTTGLTAAAIGAAMARGLGMSVLDGLDGPALAARARRVLDPRPPRVVNPILKEAIRRADALAPEPVGVEWARVGAGRLRERRAAVVTPRRGDSPIGDSAPEATADAPGRAGPPAGEGEDR